MKIRLTAYKKKRSWSRYFNFGVFLLIKRFWPMKFLITKCLYGKSFLNYYNFANYSYRFCYIWSSCDFLGLSNHTQVIAIQANQVKSPSYIVQVKSQRALKSPNHWEWWLSSDSNHKSLESLWLGTNSAPMSIAFLMSKKELAMQ